MINSYLLLLYLYIYVMLNFDILIPSILVQNKFTMEIKRVY